MELDNWVDMMVRVYGEVCKKTTAARIIGCASSTVNRMIDDGRLEAAAGGTRVSVRSIVCACNVIRFSS